MSNLNYNGQLIAQRVSDNYVNATQVSKANSKELKHWNENSISSSYMIAVSQQVGIPTDRLVEKVSEGF